MMRFNLIFVLLICDFVYGPKVNPLRASITNSDQRAFIKCHVLLGTPASNVSSMLVRIAGSNALSERQVFRVYHQFAEEGRLTCEDAPRPGRPCTATDEEHQVALQSLLNEDRCWTTDQLANQLGISHGSTLRLLDQLEVRKVASRWVPYALTESQKELRVNISREHLQRYRSDPEFLNRIIAIDETWIKSYDPADDTSAREWRYPGEEP